jgi:hypothetical protein
MGWGAAAPAPGLPQVEPLLPGLLPQVRPPAAFAGEPWAISQQIGDQETVGGAKTPGRSSHWATAWQARGAERRPPGAKRRGLSHPTTDSRRAVCGGRAPASDAPAATNPAYPSRAAPSAGQRQPGPTPRPSPRHGADSWRGCLLGEGIPRPGREYQAPELLPQDPGCLPPLGAAWRGRRHPEPGVGVG